MARSFNGTSDSALQGSAFGGGTVGSFTFSAWLKSSAVVRGCWAGVVETGTTGVFQVWINTQDTTTNTTSRLFCQIRDTAGNSDTANATQAAVADGAFHHHAIVRSGAAFIYYFDGAAQTLTLTTNLLGAGNITFARPLSLGARNLRGVIDSFLACEVALPAYYNAALSADQVAALAAGYHPSLIAPESLVSAYELDGGSPEPDRWGGNSLTLSGTSLTADPPLIYPSGIVNVNKAAATGNRRRRLLLCGRAA
jgi:hypothetical protein